MRKQIILLLKSLKGLEKKLKKYNNQELTKLKLYEHPEFFLRVYSIQYYLKTRPLPRSLLALGTANQPAPCGQASSIPAAGCIWAWGNIQKRRGA
jgi:hypothetical protein